MTGKETWFTGLGVGVGVLFAAGLGLYSFLSSMETPLYSGPQDVPSSAQAAASQEWTRAVEQARPLARARVVEQNLPGLSVAVGLGDEIVWAEGFGWADLENQVRVTPATRFRIGHASKALTSAAVGLLLEKERLHLDDEIQKYVPSFPRKEWPVTLRQLMGHVAGIRHYRNEADYMPTARCERASQGLPMFADDPLLFEPETQYKYSTFGWILVSAAVEAAGGEPFFGFMRTQVFEPLGMADTTADVGVAPLPDRATFYYPRLSGDPAFGPEPATEVDYSCFAGAGGFLSTPSDLVRFGLALNGESFLQRATIRKLRSPQLLASNEETEYGLGWMLETVTLAGQQAQLASHASRTPLGGSASLLTFPERGLVVAVTSNISYANTTAIAMQIAEVFAGSSAAAK
jgi:CubicO group peptidase (beta-lactamase class C family)